MNKPKLDFYTPVEGRFINGSMDQLRKIDQDRKPLPEDRYSYDFGIAFPKAAIWPLLAEKFYPWLLDAFRSDADALDRIAKWFQQPGLNARNGGFSMKIWDGDKPGKDGRTNEYAQGCLVFQCTSFGQGESAIPPQIVAGESVGNLTQIELSQIKRGDYVAISGSIVANGNTRDRVGVYMNCQMVWKLRDGEAISGSADPNAAFGGATLQGSFDPNAPARSAFGATLPGHAPMPGHTVPPTSVPAQGLPGYAPMPGPVGVQPPAPPQTASVGDTVPHTDILKGPPKLPGMP